MTTPDPRYDYSKLTAFIDGVNSVVPVNKRLMTRSLRSDILLWAFPFERPIRVIEPVMTFEYLEQSLKHHAEMLKHAFSLSGVTLPPKGNQASES